MKAGAPENADSKVDQVSNGDEEESLMQKRHHHSHRARDTYDQDPDTSSMYDDGHVYTDTAGSVKWKYAGGPAAEYQANTGFNPYKLVQHKHHHHRNRRDTFDQDPTTTSMYDDGHVYTDKAGSLKNEPKPVKEEKKEAAPEAKKEAAPPAKTLMHKKHHHKHIRKGQVVGSFAQDTYDQDPDTTSMYDDGHVYTDDAGHINWKYEGGPAAEYQKATGYNPYSLVQ
jgi:hypothetical protein